MAQPDQPVGHDEQRLAELGYKQELTRAWSSFTNFAGESPSVVSGPRLFRQARW